MSWVLSVLFQLYYNYFSYWKPLLFCKVFAPKPMSLLLRSPSVEDARGGEDWTPVIEFLAISLYMEMQQLHASDHSYLSISKVYHVHNNLSSLGPRAVLGTVANTASYLTLNLHTLFWYSEDHEQQNPGPEMWECQQILELVIK